MKLVILGANGRTGSHVVRQALDQGAEVTAIVRSQDKRPSFEHDRLTVVVGDPCDPDFLADVFQGHDAAISTLGGRTPTKKGTSVYYLSADAIFEAAWETGLKKVVVTSSALLFPKKRLLDRLLAVLVHNVVTSATRMEKILWGAELDVVVARCGFLTDTEETEYRASKGALPERGSSVSRRSLAHFLLDAVRCPEKGHQVYGVSRPTVREAQT